MASRTRFVLGGGGSLGAYQAGSLLALCEAGVEPDAVYGCSAGALNGAFLASDPGLDRARELVAWWSHEGAARLLAPRWRSHVRGLPALLRGGAQGVLDAHPLRELIAANVPAHDISELAIPVTVTTTCLDCGTARHACSGNVVDLLTASCALPGLFAPVLLEDGHRHVDGGVVSGVPVQAALADAGPDDRIVVLDCGFAPVTSRAGWCAAAGGSACGLAVPVPRGPYRAPVERTRGPLDVVLQAFTVARGVANTAAVGAALDDPRVSVAPHLADAWAAGLLDRLPTGPRDISAAPALSRAGREATAQWLAADAAVVPGQAARSQ